MTTPLGAVQKTNRGFELIQFKDRYGTPCSIQQSSIADYEPPGSTAVWLGVGRTRMHIDRELAKALVAVLEQWIEYGSFKENS